MPASFTLNPGRWYAMTIYPGYGSEPYRSPIEVHRITPLGNRSFDLAFYNAGYASGLQEMEKTFRTLHRHRCALIAQDAQNKDRTVIFEALTMPWAMAFAPNFGAMMIEALQRPGSLSQYQPQ